jgi:hypothetical protein
MVGRQAATSTREERLARLAGFTIYHAIPAGCGLPSGFSAMPSAPRSLPFAHITCCLAWCAACIYARE